MSIANKIAQIIAKAESTTSPEEAETFMAKARQLMESHGISLFELGTLDKEDPVAVDKDVAHSFASEGWVKHVAGQLGRYYGCTVITTQVARNKFMYSVAGRESARITFIMMLPYVLKEIRRHAREGVNAGEFDTISKGKTAMGNAMTFRLARMTREVQTHTEQTMAKATANALVPVNEIDSALAAAFGELTTGRKVRLGTNSAARNRAASINVNEQVARGSGRKRLS